MTGTPDQSWFSEKTATFGDRLAGAREAQGLSQEGLARRLGVKLKTIQAWEDDMSEPRANRLQMMAGLLNVSIRWLLTGEGEGLEGPAAPTVLSDDARRALADLSRMRAQMLVLVKDMGQMEKRLRALLREEVE
ncbi:helix-turn-helix domain-containing protein [Aliigemmobacter aestuarii]|uniref:Helix-turn-helix domain-containing protein n=1 Tax=Aliigemmobacter aestuarii TaxID=1445661 RepID=A0A4S3MMV4_9RHOB|nr:helix-turn-helix domain-containing protein [Gemmobacter aestuarii]THD82197.1 helix-turn-helix domain-containing protein [Gemmobacter aestuarii]